MREFKMEQKIAENATFIVGVARSGTSLLRGLLDNHPQLIVFPNEMKFFRLTKERLDAEVILKRSQFHMCFDSVYAIPGIDYEKVKADLDARFQSVRNLREAMVAVIETYAAIEPSRGPEKARWVEKTPSNHSFVPLLTSWFANSRYIWMVRDPRAVFKSVRAKHPDQSLTNFCSNYLSYLINLRLAQAKIPQQVLCVQYENLVTDTPGEMARIANFLGVKYSSSLETTSLAGINNPGKPWVPHKVHKDSLQKDSPFVGADEIVTLVNLLAPELEAFGYREAGGRPARPIWLRYKLLKHGVITRLLWLFPLLSNAYIYTGYWRRFRAIIHSRL